ncbi:hypothetical protein LY76DRAFT_603365 [Colletotrichum caudatum]|nr:hypothetical protein LY76DRAFT_603365 [Colletotrichum caudatum]
MYRPMVRGGEESGQSWSVASDDGKSHHRLRVGSYPRSNEVVPCSLLECKTVATSVRWKHAHASRPKRGVKPACAAIGRDGYTNEGCPPSAQFGGPRMAPGFWVGVVDGQSQIWRLASWHTCCGGYRAVPFWLQLRTAGIASGRDRATSEHNRIYRIVTFRESAARVIKWGA